ncbi:hypothetical protein [Pseudobacteriovorax antillogorgiicola]|uniref:Uncharacterized protein n=1 Tax=Pseudobacteriovorax antillogorgiicola TaxID=1513793 RepID=A0A1Y6BNS1_9BACT|nr:hypothetical protein [Pseudobacteriovorax antillogorgiicola]TCS55596.1 hypothetical protein EDD56_105322 [Pseudobacteriovorax antillogorgiicola]SMF10454.1 hypothetical protein SAMN06296036_1052 [Pseudobacteriovorax antillogorgiicola]
MQNRIHATVADRVYALAFDLFAVMMPTMYGLPFFASKSLGIEIDGGIPQKMRTNVY